jgi:hypothetical protein
MRISLRMLGMGGIGEEGEDVRVIIEGLPGMVERMSIFPSGRQLILEIEGEGYLVDISGGRMRALELGEMRDEELGGIKLIDARDFCAGPKEKMVTFSGKSVDAEGKVRWRIYSCRVDGKGLKALTPVREGPVAERTHFTLQGSGRFEK